MHVVETATHAFVEAAYDPNNLLDTLIELLGFKNDAELSRELGITQAMVSRIRHCRARVGPSVLVRMHELSHLSTRELKRLMHGGTLQTRTPLLERRAA
jgi:hypothetical protein